MSLEAFRTPNFILVADILQWLVHRYDADASFPTDIEKETDRILFLKSIASIMHDKARIKLSLRRLYGADALAVREMLKIATVLGAAVRVRDRGLGDAGSELHYAGLEPDVKRTRQLAVDITALGAALYDALGREPALRAARNTALASSLDIDELGRRVQAAAAALVAKTAQTEGLLGGLAADEAQLTTKRDRKRDELARKERRLNELQSKRPAFADEQDRLEAELRRRFELYAERHRNLAYLEAALDRYASKDAQTAARDAHSLAQMRQRLQRERSGAEDDDDENGACGPRGDDAAGSDSAGDMMPPPTAPVRKAPGSAGAIAAAPRVYGSMLAGDDDDEGGASAARAAAHASHVRRGGGGGDDDSDGGRRAGARAAQGARASDSEDF